jgi:hypothetical protein
MTNTQHVRSLWKTTLIAGFMTLAIGSLPLMGHRPLGASAQEATPGSLAGHPLVGTWMVDTNTETDTDAPEIGIFTADGSTFGLGASRWVSGTWEASDETAGNATLVGVFDGNGGGYVVLRGIHTVDASGDAWTCDCTFTVVGADGTVLDAGSAPAMAHRIPVQGVELAGQGLTDMPVWAPMMAATPTP